MSTTYIRLTKSDTWHFHPACSYLPAVKRGKHTTRAKKPTLGEFCNQCLAKKRNDSK